MQSASAVCSFPFRGAKLRVHGAVCAFLSFSIVGFGKEPVPPRPDTSQPVNYIDWVNEALGGLVKDNAQASYQAAFAALKPFEGDWDPALDGPWTGHPETARWLKANQEGLKKFRAAATKSECFFPLMAPKATGKPRTDSMILMVMVELPQQLPLSSFRLASQALLAEGWQAWQAGDQKALPANALVVLRGTKHLQSHPYLVAHLTSYAIAARAYAGLRSALHLSTDRVTLAKTLVRESPDADLPRVPFSHAMLGERLVLWDTAQRVFMPGKGGTGGEINDEVFQLLQNISSGDDAGFKESDEAPMARIGFDETIRVVDAYFKAADEWCQTPYHRAVEQLPNLARILQESNNPLVQKMIPSYNRIREMDARCTASQRATHLIVHLLVHRGKNGSYPESLAQLEVSGRDDVKIDPFSGKDFVYRRQSDDFVLYSIAENAKDDGGTHHDKGSERNRDFVYWPVQGGY